MIRASFVERTSLFFLAFAFLFGVVACGSESKAERLYDKARKHVESEELRDAIDVYQQVIDRYPDSDAARRARQEIVLYRGLAEAVRRFPGREARDLMVQTARAIERYRARRRQWPASLDKLMPGLLHEPPVDPWGRALIYEKKPRNRGYLLACYGADGQPGGEGDEADWFVEDGRFVVQPGASGR